jgi:putative transcriptional regulator
MLATSLWQAILLALLCWAHPDAAQAAGREGGAAVRAAGPAGPAALILVAAADLHDPNFVRSVVLVTTTPDKELIGVILNRPTQLPWPSEIGAAPPAGDTHVYYGGPLATDVLFAVGSTTGAVEGTFDLGDGLRLALGLKSIRALAAARPAAGDARLKLFRGCAGWGAGQLREELAAGAWEVRPLAPALVFDPRPEELWERLTEIARAARLPAAPRGRLALQARFDLEVVGAVDRLHADILHLRALEHP